MQLPPLNYLDVSLLLGLGVLVFLITLELSSSHLGLTSLAINRKRLRNVTIAVGALFLITVGIRVVGILFNVQDTERNENHGRETNRTRRAYTATYPCSGQERKTKND
jgi:hypothetical protein